MKHLVNSLKKYYVLLIVPLTCISFFFETDSSVGKALLILKLLFMAGLYIIYACDINKENLILLLLSLCSMIVTVLTRQGIGLAVLTLVLFLSLIGFPQIRLSMSQCKFFYYAMSCVCGGLFIYGTAKPLSVMIQHKALLVNTVPYVDYYGPFNPNMCGILLLAFAFYLFSAIDVNYASGFGKNLKFVLLFCITAIVMFFIGCRSAFLALFAFLCLTIWNHLVTSKVIKYYIYFIFIILFSIVILFSESDLFRIFPKFTDIMVMNKDIISGRGKIWDQVLQGFFDNPVWGQGSKYLALKTGYSTAHSVFLGLLVSFGTIPAVFYLRLLLDPIQLFQIKKEVTAQYSISQLCFFASLVVSIFECTFTDAWMNFLFLPFLFRNSHEDINYERKV